MRLYDLAQVVRSKNAGPFTLTIDLVLSTEAEFDALLAAPAFSPAAIGRLYGVSPEQVRIHPFRKIRTVKVTFPRPGASSGAPGDRDVYGSQQHFPLADLEV
mgnify:CR=1 FL=1